MKPRVVVLGNCQARPLAALLSDESADVLATGVVHLMRSEDFSSFKGVLDECDFIIAQQVADNYPCEFVTTKFLKDSYGDKVLSIINLYFGAYNPELIYVRLKDRTLSGPLGDYHIESVVSAWRRGLVVQDVCSLIRNSAHNESLYAGFPERAFTELRRREHMADVQVVELIEKSWKEQKLFHTMNHPSNYLLASYAQLICKSIGTNVTSKFSESEFLNKYTAPTNEYIKSHYALTFNDETDFDGVLTGAGLMAGCGEKISYDLESLVLAFYRIYDESRDAMSAWVDSNSRLADLTNRL